MAENDNAIIPATVPPPADDVPVPPVPEPIVEVETSVAPTAIELFSSETSLDNVPEIAQNFVNTVNTDAQTIFSTDLENAKITFAEDAGAEELKQMSMLVDQTTGEMKLAGEEYLKQNQIALSGFVGENTGATESVDVFSQHPTSEIVPVAEVQEDQLMAKESDLEAPSVSGSPKEGVIEDPVEVPDEVDGEVVVKEDHKPDAQLVDPFDDFDLDKAAEEVKKIDEEYGTPITPPVQNPERGNVEAPTEEAPTTTEAEAEAETELQTEPVQESRAESEENNEEDEDEETEESDEEKEPDVPDAGTEEGVIADEINQRVELGQVELDNDPKTSGYDTLRRWFPRMFHGILDRMEANSAKKKANKLSVYLTRMEAETNSWNTRATSGAAKLATLQSQLDAINSQSIAPEEKDRISAPVVAELGRVKRQIEEAETEIKGLIARRDEAKSALRAVEFDRDKAVLEVTNRYDNVLNPHKETYAQLEGERAPVASALQGVKDEIAGLFSRMRKLQADKATASKSHDVILALNSEINSMYKEQTTLEKQLGEIDSRMITLRGTIGKIQRERDRYDQIGKRKAVDLVEDTARVENHSDMIDDAKAGVVEPPKTPEPVLPDSLVEDHTVPPSTNPERTDQNPAPEGKKARKARQKVVPNPEPAQNNQPQPTPSPEAVPALEKKKKRREVAPANATPENTPAPEAQPANPENIEQEPASLNALIQRWNRLVKKNKFSDEIKIAPKGADKKIIQTVVKLLEADDSRATKFDQNNLTGADFKEFIEEIVLDKGIKGKKLKEANKVLTQVVSKLKPTVINI